jgi:hypothetical protein
VNGLVRTPAVGPKSDSYSGSSYSPYERKEVTDPCLPKTKPGLARTKDAKESRRIRGTLTLRTHAFC